MIKYFTGFYLIPQSNLLLVVVVMVMVVVVVNLSRLLLPPQWNHNYPQ